jgi:hypothetical protein
MIVFSLAYQCFLAVTAADIAVAYHLLGRSQPLLTAKILFFNDNSNKKA